MTVSCVLAGTYSAGTRLFRVFIVKQQKYCFVCSEFNQYNEIISRKVVEISLVKIYNERQRHEEKMYKMKADLK